MSVNQTENNYAFIDSQNLNLAIRDQEWILGDLEGIFRINMKYARPLSL